MKHTNHPPFIFRSMLLSLFLPIFIAFGVLIHAILTYADDSLWEEQALIGGIPIVWFSWFLIIFPFLLGIWLLVRGQWRLPVFVAGTLYFGISLLSNFDYLKQYTPPEKRIIHLHSGIYEKTDVYCNGVYLGQTPLKIRVEELKAKVPEWTNPPEQYWFYENSEPNVYTWIPWDDFRDKKRFLEARELSDSVQQSGTLFLSSIQKKQSFLYDAGCRYWWRFENNKSRILAAKSPPNHQYFRQPFEEKQVYYFLDNERGIMFAPSAATHAWLLVNVLDKLTEAEKNEWDKHVLKYWQLFRVPLTNALKQEAEKYRLRNPADSRAELFETALNSTARLKYGLSDPPTEEECRRLLTNWVQESSDKRRPFVISNQYSMRMVDTDISVRVEPYIEESLIGPAVRLMGETIRKPLAEQWKTNYYRFEDGWAPLLYVSGKDRDAEYFNDFVRYFATTYNGQLDLLANQNERVIPLFKTFLYRKSIFDLSPIGEDPVDRYQSFVSGYCWVNNPLLEPIYRDYIAYALSYPNHTESSYERLNRSIFNAVWVRINREETDKDELAVWVNSLPLNQVLKNILLRKINVTRGDVKLFADLIARASEFMIWVETKITAEDVNRWFAENPNGTLNKFYKEFSEDLRFGVNPYLQNSYRILDGNIVDQKIQVNDKEFSGYFLTALLNTNTPETQKTIKQLCDNDMDRGVVLSAIIRTFSPQTMLDSNSGSTNFFESFIDYPDFIFDIFETLKGRDEKKMLALRLEFCLSPRVEQILEKWSQTENPIEQQRFTHALENWRKRKEIQEQTKKLFHELVEEKILPDDLLTPQTPWVWKDGKYVQKSSR